MQHVEQALPLAAAPQSSFLAMAGSALVSVGKHVVTRGFLWALLGLVFGLLAVGGSLLLGLITLDRGAGIMVAGPWVIVPILTPFAGMALFGLHGVHRGAARAVLELETRLGLVRHIADRVIGLVETQVGTQLANLPLAQVETVLRQATCRYLGSDDGQPGRGVSGWVLRRARRLISAKLDTYLLGAYRAEVSANGGGGVDLRKVGARVSEEISANLGDLVMSPLKKQLLVLLVVFFSVGIGWFHLALGVAMLISRFSHGAAA